MSKKIGDAIFRTIYDKQKKMRHEQKYLMSYADYIIIRQKLKAVCHLDPNAEDGEYFIRSLYFDTPSDSAYYEKLAGVGERKKYRLRIYNGSSELIKLECKEKIGNLIYKRSVKLNIDEANSILQGDFQFLARKDNELCLEVFSVVNSRGLKPSVIVDYNREAYIHEVSNTRLTFDKFLTAGGGNGCFDIFDKNIFTSSVFPNDSVIFEVKYDTVIPKHLSLAIANNSGAKLALSKFVMCKEKLSSLNIK